VKEEICFSCLERAFSVQIWLSDRSPRIWDRS